MNKNSWMVRLDNLIDSISAEAVQAFHWDGTGELAAKVALIVPKLHAAGYALQDNQYCKCSYKLRVAVLRATIALQFVDKDSHDSKMSASFFKDVVLPIMEFKDELHRCHLKSILEDEMENWVDKDAQSALNKEYQYDTDTDA
jgi:hypothetical protein